MYFFNFVLTLKEINILPVGAIAEAAGAKAATQVAKKAAAKAALHRILTFTSFKIVEILN